MEDHAAAHLGFHNNGQPCCSSFLSLPASRLTPLAFSHALLHTSSFLKDTPDSIPSLFMVWCSSPPKQEQNHSPQAQDTGCGLCSSSPRCGRLFCSACCALDTLQASSQPSAPHSQCSWGFQISTWEIIFLNICVLFPSLRKTSYRLARLFPFQIPFGVTSPFAIIRASPEALSTCDLLSLY